MSSDVKNCKGIGDLVESYYVEYGRYVNSSRALPTIYDGLKPSYRKLIYTQIKYGGKKQKSTNLIGDTMKIFSHGDSSLSPVIDKLVQKHIFIGYGSFGYNAMWGKSLGAAAPRYTSVQLAPIWYSMLAPMMDVVPFHVSESDDSTMEPDYLPFALPLALCIGTKGIAISMNTDVPAFSPKSLLDAYLNNDYRKLRPAFDIIIDHENSDIESLWTEGTGRVNYKYHLRKAVSDDGYNGIYVSGNTSYFIPDWTILDEWRSEGLIFIRDESVGEKGCIFIARNKNIRKISDEELFDEVKRCTASVNATNILDQSKRLGVFDGYKSKYISMYDWIDFTYNNYSRLYDLWKESKLKKLRFDLLVYKNIPKVARIIQDNPDITDEELLSLKLPEDVIKAILRKSLSTLRRKDTSKEIADIMDNIKYYNSLDPDTEIKNLINGLE